MDVGGVLLMRRFIAWITGDTHGQSYMYPRAHATHPFLHSHTYITYAHMHIYTLLGKNHSGCCDRNT